MAVRCACKLALGLGLCAMVVFAGPAAALASSISGTVTAAAAGHAPIAGVEVCVEGPQQTGEDTCVTTEAAGHYVLAGLPANTWSVEFSDWMLNRNFVDQFYGGGHEFPGTQVVLGPSEDVQGVNAELVAGSAISGTVTDADSHAPIAGVPACALAFFGPHGFAQRCASTGGDGKYRINGLPPGEYTLDFQSGKLNYQELELPGHVTIAGAEEVIDPIDAAMHVGAEISGTLTEVGTGKPLAGIEIDLLWAKGGNSLAWTDAGGHYTFRALPEGDYVVHFSPAKGPLGADVDGYSQQYYEGSETLAGATVLHAVPGTALTGINGEVSVYPPKDEPVVTVSIIPTPVPGPGAVPRPFKCRSGFQKKKINGKMRCVKRHKHHRRHRHHRQHAGAL